MCRMKICVDMKKMYSLIIGSFVCLLITPISIVAIPPIVELVSFEVVNSGADVQLFWTTSSELNTDYYHIEKSRDNITWFDVTSVDAVGNSSSLVNYSYLDHDAFPGPAFYRLVEYDTNGDSIILSIGATTVMSTDNLEVYPNPADLEIFVEAEDNIASMDITLTDLTGNPIDFSFENIGSKTIINTSGLKNGVYLLQSQFGKSITSKRIVVNHNR